MTLSVRIQKKYRDFTLDVALEAKEGVTALLGASGCGKSLTLKCIAGLVRPDAGRIVLHGRTLFDSAQRIHLPPQQRRVGYLFQHYALFPHMTVAQNILCGLLRETDRAQRRKKLHEAMESFYLTGLARHYPHQLSGGQQQRVALARMLVGQPQLLMLDEPFSALDSYLKWKLEQELMDALARFGGTTLFVSHSREEVYRLCQHVCVIDHGTSQPVCSVKELFDAPTTLAAALLCGYKNFSHMVRIDTSHVHAVDWGVTLPRGAGHGNANLLAVQAGHIALSATPVPGSFPCRLLRQVEDLHARIYVLAPIGGDETSDYGYLRVELPRSQATPPSSGGILHAQIAPQDILLLRSDNRRTHAVG